MLVFNDSSKEISGCETDWWLIDSCDEISRRLRWERDELSDEMYCDCFTETCVNF